MAIKTGTAPREMIDTGVIDGWGDVIAPRYIPIGIEADDGYIEGDSGLGIQDTGV